MEEEYSHYTDGYTIELGDSTYNIKDSSVYGSVRIYRLKYQNQLKEYERAHETLKYSLERMDII